MSINFSRWGLGFTFFRQKKDFDAAQTPTTSISVSPTVALVAVAPWIQKR
jgi:hypothetical protein